MKNVKKWVALLAALTMTASLGALTACGDNSGDTTGGSTGGTENSTPTPETKTYTVTVTMPDGTPAVGVTINFCIGENCQPVRTDENGVAVLPFEDDETIYHVEYKLPLDSMYESAGTAYTEFNTVPGTTTYTMQLNAFVPAGGDDNTGDDNTGGDNTGGDNTGGDNTGDDNTGGDNTGDDNTGGDNTGDDNTGDDNTGDDNTGGDTLISGAGTFDNPFVIEVDKSYCAAKELVMTQGLVCYSIAMPTDGTYTIHLPFTNDGNPCIEIGGVTYFDGDTVSAKAGCTLNIYVSNYDNEGACLDTYFSLSFAEGAVTEDGSSFAPYTLVSGTTYTVESWNQVYYSFTAPTDGQYKISLANYATVCNDFSFLGDEGATFARGVATNIQAGETLQFYAYSYLDDDASWTFYFSADGLDNDAERDSTEEIPVGAEENPLMIDTAGTQTFTVGAGATYHISLMAPLQFTVPTGCTVHGNGTTYEAGQVFAFDTYDKGLTSFLNITLTNTTEAELEVTLVFTDFVIAE